MNITDPFCGNKENISELNILSLTLYHCLPQYLDYIKKVITILDLVIIEISFDRPIGEIMLASKALAMDGTVLLKNFVL